MNYRKKPIVIQAVQFQDTAESLVEISEFAPGDIVVSYKDKELPHLKIETLEGTMQALPGDWIIKGVKGEFYPCKPDIFAATYEAVS